MNGSTSSLRAASDEVPHPSSYVLVPAGCRKGVPRVAGRVPYTVLGPVYEGPGPVLREAKPITSLTQLEYRALATRDISAKRLYFMENS